MFDVNHTPYNYLHKIGVDLGVVVVDVVVRIDVVGRNVVPVVPPNEKLF